MSPKKNNIQLFLKSLPKNIFSGFVVSLIAFPLCLGLAMASEAPPIAGIITAIIGGIVVSILGGSNVTITGPGNGLVGVTLVAITALGLEGAYAAIICSGVLMTVLGFLRMGKLSDFFPSSAIQGMLAAIGLIILGKQFHIMLGNKISQPSNIDYLLEIPNTIIGVFNYDDTGLIYAAIIGVISLLIIIFYPRIRNKYLQLIPAPMWIVLLSIGFSYFFELVLKQPNPVNENYMISTIPNVRDIVGNLPVPDFSQFGSFPFFESVIALVLIASIESLLSIKAVDNLDPEKRRSNVNKDLKAIGLATVGSGFLGGLNVVTVIARSSVNVNNGGSNRSSNFFHAIFLLLFIALFSSQMTRIPLPALMSILVFTGYKLASPKIVRNLFSIGKEQLLIFFVTLFVTLQVGLITGIALGVLTTLVTHILISKNVALFVRNILKPNVLMFKEQEDDTKYYVSIKHFCSFLNFFKLKQKLDAIPEDNNVIVDFSQCEFVDHTVMENLNTYQELFKKKGGHFEVIGLDMHETDSKHPFALRKVKQETITKPNNLTKRQMALSEIAVNFNLNYTINKELDIQLDSFGLFKTKKIERTYNFLNQENEQITMFDISFSEGAFIAKEVIRSTMLHFNISKNIPSFTLEREGFLEKVSAFAGFTDINIDGASHFSNRFYLKGENETAIRAFFSPKLIRFLESNKDYHIESFNNQILIYDKERILGLNEIKALLDFGRRFQKVIEEEVN